MVDAEKVDIGDGFLKWWFDKWFGVSIGSENGIEELFFRELDFGFIEIFIFW
jgi:hypothetical protein